METPTVRIRPADHDLASSLTRKFARLGFEVLRPVSGKRAQPSTFGVWLPRGLPRIPRRKLQDHLQCQFPMIFPSAPLEGDFLTTSFSRGAFVCCSLTGLSARRSVNLIARKTEDLLSMARMMGEWPASSPPPSWFEAFAAVTDLGLSVLDRNFRIWYRNDAHQRIAGSRSSCRLCWVAYHGLENATKPCPNCPSAEVFKRNKGPAGPVRMVIGFEPGDKRPARPTVVTAVPLRNRDQKIVGAIEIVKDTMAELEGGSILDLDEWLSAMLTRVFLSDFARARLFLLSPNREQLIGCVAVGDPAPRTPVPSMRIPVVEDPPTLPDCASLRRLSDYARDQVYYYDELDKAKAPYWVDFPLMDTSGSIIGKIIVDRWSESDSASRRILPRDLSGFEKGIELICRVVTLARAITSERERIGVVETLRYYLQTTPSLSSLDEQYDLLLHCVDQVPGVVSALIREPAIGQHGQAVLKVRRGYGAYSRHCIADLAAQDSSVAGEVYASARDAVILITTPETLQLTEGDISCVRPPHDRKELESIRYQGTFRIRGHERDALLSVQAATANCFDHDSIRLLARAAKFALDSFFVRRFPLKEERQKAFRLTSGAVAHRLQNVLPVITDRLDMVLSAKVADSKIMNWVRTALDEARRAQDIVSGFFEFFRSEMFQCTDVLSGAELVTHLGSLLRSAVTQRGAKVVVRRPAELPLVRVNLGRLAEDFRGFMRDSQRHKPAKLRITLSGSLADPTEIRRTTLRSDVPFVRISYADNGPGIPYDRKQRIFEPFFTTTNGTGLGLAMASHNAGVHGGALVEAGKPGRGVRFDLYLPIRGSRRTGRTR